MGGWSCITHSQGNTHIWRRQRRTPQSYSGLKTPAMKYLPATPDHDETDCKAVVTFFFLQIHKSSWSHLSVGKHLEHGSSPSGGSGQQQWHPSLQERRHGGGHRENDDIIFRFLFSCFPTHKHLPCWPLSHDVLLKAHFFLSWSDKYFSSRIILYNVE